MAKLSTFNNPFTRRIQIVISAFWIGLVCAVVSSPLKGLFSYIIAVAVLDGFITFIRKNAYLNSVNPLRVKQASEVSLEEFKKYTRFTATRRLSIASIFLMGIAIETLAPLFDFFDVLTMYFFINLGFFLVAKLKGMKFPSFITHNSEINPERTWEERRRDFSASNTSSNPMAQSLYNLNGTHISNIWRDRH